MAYRIKDKSPVVEKSEDRAAGVKTVDDKKGSKQNYGTASAPLTIDEFTGQIAVVENKRKEGNELLKRMDQINNEYEAEENKLDRMYTQILASAVSVLGDDSDEYELLGGTKRSERKHPVRKPKTN